MEAFVNVLLVALVCDVTSANDIQDSKYWIRNNVILKQDYIMDEYATRTIISCMSICSRKDGCLTVSWSSVDKKCLLSAIDQTNDNSYSQLPDEVIIMSGWKTATRIRFPGSFSRFKKHDIKKLSVVYLLDLVLL